MSDNIISLFLQYRESNGTLDFINSDLDNCVKEKKKDSKELFEFINKKVHPKIRNKLIHLIEKYNNDSFRQNYVENELYYKLGFSDGIKVLLTALYM